MVTSCSGHCGYRDEHTPMGACSLPGGGAGPKQRKRKSKETGNCKRLFQMEASALTWKKAGWGVRRGRWLSRRGKNWGGQRQAAPPWPGGISAGGQSSGAAGLGPGVPAHPMMRKDQRDTPRSSPSRERSDLNQANHTRSGKLQSWYFWSVETIEVFAGVRGGGWYRIQICFSQI